MWTITSSTFSTYVLTGPCYFKLSCWWSFVSQLSSLISAGVIGRSKFFETVNEILETLEWGGLKDALKGVDFYFHYYNNN